MLNNKLTQGEAKVVRINRRQFCKSLAVASAFSIVGCRKTDRSIAGSFVNDSYPLGHRLRDHDRFAKPGRTIKIPIVIVGGGIAGLSAGWKLQKLGIQDFVILEMEKQAGGTSRHMEYEVGDVPYAAHYIPVPNKNSHIERELFRDIGLLLPNGNWNQQYICSEPQERLFIDGEWQDGIEPTEGANQKDRNDFEQFGTHVDRYRDTGEFTIPIDRKSV